MRFNNKLKIVGLMSGTSCDGLDIALIEILGFGEKTNFNFLNGKTVPYSSAQRALLIDFISADNIALKVISQLNFYLPKIWSEMMLNFLNEIGLNTSDIDLIGSHGQTVWHQPGAEKIEGKQISSTLQIGDPAVLAQLLGIPVVGDFRVADVAVGGQGEYDVAQAVDITIVVLVPESGDEIQLMKAGLIEIADIFVINKSDRPDANRLAKTLKLVLESSTKPIEPAVINTTANDGEGITKLYEKIFSRLGKMSEKGIIKKKRLDRHRNRVFDLIQNRLLKEFWTSKRLVELEQRTNNLESTKSSAYQIAEEIMENAK